jgi:hypothetical protein
METNFFFLNKLGSFPAIVRQANFYNDQYQRVFPDTALSSETSDGI